MGDGLKLRPAGGCEGAPKEPAFLELRPLLEVVPGCCPRLGSPEQLPGEVCHCRGHLAHADSTDAQAKDWALLLDGCIKGTWVRLLDGCIKGTWIGLCAYNSPFHNSLQASLSPGQSLSRKYCRLLMTGLRPYPDLLAQPDRGLRGGCIGPHALIVQPHAAHDVLVEPAAAAKEGLSRQPEHSAA